VRRIGIEERRARLGLRHHLAAPAPDPVAAARSVVALHATDPATVFLSAYARAPVEVKAIEHALYEERSLVRMLGMRRTMFVVPVDLAPVIQAGCADAIAEQQRRRYTQFIVDSDLGDGAWLADVAESTARALAARGEATAAELCADEPRLRSQVTMHEGKAYGGAQNITTWVLFLLAAEGRIVRGRPRGSWTSSQWRWSPVTQWLPGGMTRPPAPAARAELVRRWLAAFGPGTVADLRWWTGWTAGQVKQALAAVGPVEVELEDGGTGLVLADDVAPVPAASPWVALLPALDPTAMGWSGRDWYVGPRAANLFDRSGNIGPTVWCDGRIVGGWAQRADGEIAYRLLEDVGSESAAAVEAAAARFAGWIGPARVVPRFRTPLERELSA
jgi:Winged helix DNA-binding domain